jgi:hypothetical protein
MVVDGDVGDSDALGQQGVLAGTREIKDGGLRTAHNIQQKQTLGYQHNPQ